MSRGTLRDETWLKGYALLAALLGVFFITSASLPDTGGALLRGPGVKQLLWVVIASVAFLVLRRLPSEWVRRSVLPFFMFVFVLCVWVLIHPSAISANGASRWLAVGPVQIQPGELAKPAVVLAFAWFLALPWPRMEKVRPRDRFVNWVVRLALPLLILGSLFVLIEREPDLGTAVFALAIPFGMLLAGGARRLYGRYAVRVVGAIVALAIVAGVFFTLAEPYRVQRLATFRDTASRDAIEGASYQPFLSQTAIALGGVTGLGVGRGHAKYLLPAATTDYIYTTIAEEIGIFGFLLVTWLLGSIFVLLIRIGVNQREAFHRYVAFGVAWWIAVQALGNLLMVTGVAPSIGIPLPFFSYGGSSLLSLAIGLGSVCALIKEPSSKEVPVAARSDRWGYGRTRLSRT